MECFILSILCAEQNRFSMIYRLTLISIFFILVISCEEKNTLLDPLQAGWKNESVCELLDESDIFRVLKCSFPPGGGHDKHFHAPHFGYALSGGKFKITDTTGVREVELKTNSHFSSEGVDWHHVENVGDSTSVYLIFEPK